VRSSVGDAVFKEKAPDFWLSCCPPGAVSWNFLSDCRGFRAAVASHALCSVPCFPAY